MFTLNLSQFHDPIEVIYIHFIKEKVALDRPRIKTVINAHDENGRVLRKDGKKVKIPNPNYKPNSVIARHHIFPKILFPELRTYPKNYVNLTKREHEYAHKLIAKLCGDLSYYGQSIPKKLKKCKKIKEKKA